MPKLIAEKPGVRIQSLDRGMRILDIVSRPQDGVSLAELSRSMGLGKTTVHNLARTLIAGGYLIQRRDPIRYVLGPALFALAGRQRGNRLHEVAVPVLLQLGADYPGSAALLAEAFGPTVRVTLRVSRESGGAVERPLDRFIPPYANATSLLFLAFWSDEDREAFQARHSFWENGAHLWSDEVELADSLRVIRGQGYATLEQAQGKALPIAFPIFSEQGELLAAIGLAYRSEKKISAVAKRELVARVRAAALQIAKGL